MPYKIVKQGTYYKVVSIHGRVLGRHKTKKSAVRQLRALYANVPDAKVKKKKTKK